MTNIKKRINIEGEKVRNVGYRPFLLAKALRLKIPNFDAENIEENGTNKLVVSIMGEEEQISEFEKFVKDNFPKKAKVSRVSIVECTSDVISIEEYRKLLNSEQFNNIIQGGLELREVTGDVGSKVDNLIIGMHDDFGKMNNKYDKVSQKMESIDSRMESIDNSIKELAKAMRMFAEALIDNKKK